MKNRVEALERENARLRQENLEIRDNEERYRSLFEALPVSLYVVDKDGRIIDVNPFHLNHMGRGHTKKEDYLGRSLASRASLIAAGMAGQFEDVLRGIPFERGGVHFPSVSGGGDGYFNVRGVPLKRGNEITGAIYISEDVTELKKAQEELTLHKERLEELVKARTAELSAALSKVKTLSGFLPICSSCKKVRDDKGYWNQVEAYLNEHSELVLSHSMCPECARKLYPEFYTDTKAP
jgi:PAS domain S-box-containing protein